MPAAAAALGGLAPSGADPILAVIAAHKAALEECLAAGTAHGTHMDRTAEWYATKPRADAAQDAELDCLFQLLTTPPRTTFGLARLLEYLELSESLDPDDDDSLTIFAGAQDYNNDVGTAARNWFNFMASALDNRLSVAELPMTKVEPAKRDPIFAAIEEHRKLNAEWGRLYTEIDEAEGDAEEQHGRRPLSAWRNYSDIGDAAIRAGEEWDERAGLAPLRAQYERAVNAARAVAMHFATTKPTTPAGAGAMVAYAIADLEDGDNRWERIALDTAAAALRSMPAGADGRVES